MATPKQPEQYRDLDSQTEIGIRQGEPNPSTKLLADYEAVIGLKLAKLEEPTKLEKNGQLWFWTWTPEQAGFFLSEWDRSIYMVNTLLRELALTESPDGDTQMFERFCRPDVRKAIENAQVMYDMPIGIIPPIPKGTYDIDLRKAPPFMRPTVFTINHWHFSGYVKGISKELRDELAYRHGQWYESGVRVFMPIDNGIIPMASVGGAR